MVLRRSSCGDCMFIAGPSDLRWLSLLYDSEAIGMFRRKGSSDERKGTREGRRDGPRGSEVGIARWAAPATAAPGQHLRGAAEAPL
jgi:hypothetical protein